LDGSFLARVFAGGKSVLARKALNPRTSLPHRAACWSINAPRAENVECRSGRMKVEKKRPMTADEPSTREKTYERRLRSERRVIRLGGEVGDQPV